MLWDKGVAYYGCFSPRHAFTDLREIAEAGFTSITLCVNDAEWPWRKPVKKFIVEAAKDLGLRVFVDVHGFGSFVPNMPTTYVPKNPNWWQFDNEGNPLALKGCPNNPSYVAWLKERVEEIVRELNPDGIFWDEPCLAPVEGWPSKWACRCRCCVEKFQDEYGFDMPKELTREVEEFRERSLFRLLDELMEVVKRVKPSALNLLCLMPEFTGMHGIKSWEPVRSLKNLDVFGTDPYWIWFNKPFEWFEEWVSRAVETAERVGVKSQVWVELIRVPAGREGDVTKAVRRAVELGVDAIATWSFRAEEGSSLACDNPDKAWFLFVEAIRSL